jgi:anti-sigma factor RsiW
MTDRTIPTEEELNAWLDDELPPPRRAELEAWLAANPEVGERLADYKVHKQAIRAIYGSVADEPVPERLVAATAPRPGGFAAPLKWAAAVAASLLLLAIGAGGGWWFRTPENATAQAAFTDRALSAHLLFVLERRAAGELASEQERRLNDLLTSRLGAAVKAPKLDEMGYRLLGGRVVPEGVTAAGQYLYEDTQGARLSLFCKPNVPEVAAPPRFHPGAEVALWDWSVAPFRCVLAGPLPETELRRAARLVRDQLRGS